MFIALQSGMARQIWRLYGYTVDRAKKTTQTPKPIDDGGKPFNLDQSKPP